MKKRKIASVASLAILGFGGAVVLYFQRNLLVQFLQWISSIGIWGNVLFVLVFLIVGFPFALGYVPLAVAAGYLYGMIHGTATVSVGALAGASMAFWLCRTLTKNWMQRKLASNPKWHVFMVEIEKNAWKITLLTRLLPFPFGLVNGLFALSSISFHVFLIGSFIGLLPFQLMWTYFGTTLRSITEAVNGEIPFGPTQQFLLFVQIALGIGLSIYLVHLGRGTLTPQPGDEGALILQEVADDNDTGSDLDITTMDYYEPDYDADADEEDEDDDGQTVELDLASSSCIPSYYPNAEPLPPPYSSYSDMSSSSLPAPYPPQLLPLSHHNIFSHHHSHPSQHFHHNQPGVPRPHGQQFALHHTARRDVHLTREKWI